VKIASGPAMATRWWAAARAVLVPARRVQAGWGPCVVSERGVARAPNRVRINRFTGVQAVKMSPPKTDWQIAAEREFLASRKAKPEGYVWGMTADDVRHLSPEMQQLLSLRHGSGQDIHRARKAELIKKFQRRHFDTGSPPVMIAVLTERILNLRAHLLKHYKHHQVKRSMNIMLARRQRIMKHLYKNDFVLYKHVCTELGIRCVRFAVPFEKHPSKNINPQAVDGDRMKFMIRQRIYKKGLRPRELREPGTNRKIRYTHHPMERVPDSHGKPKRVPLQVSTAWPYGVTGERAAGKQIVYNPTAPGLGYWPTKGGGTGGPTP